MAKKVAISFASIMNMKEKEFVEFVQREGKMAELSAIASRSTEQKVYPRVKMESKNIPGKFTYQADKSQKPMLKLKPITFFEVKAAFADEVLKLEKKEKTASPTFRDRIAAAALAAAPAE